MAANGDSQLQSEIDRIRTEIKTDGYDLSIGEWMSIYERGELDIHPEFQRFFRWDEYQKTALIESIMLGIPIPIIFVAQRPDGVWDVIDGLQRLSTIFQFAGMLRNESGELEPPLALKETRYLPSLNGMMWQNDRDEQHSFTTAQRLQIKRSKLGVSIILAESGQRTKYDLFQRLNRGGSPLSDQEVRTCVLVLENAEMYRWIRRLSQAEFFRNAVSITDKASEEQYDLELVLRFLTLRSLDTDSLKGIGDINVFLTDKMLELAALSRSEWAAHEEAFNVTFEAINTALGSDAFRKFDPNKGRFTGGFLISAFEAVAIGVGYRPEQWAAVDSDKLRSRVEQLWKTQGFLDSIGGGVRASQRLPKIVPLARDIFAV